MTPEDRALLTYEENTWGTPGISKEHTIRARFGITPTRYYQRLRSLMGTRDAAEEFPMLVRMWMNRHDRRAS